MNSRLAYFSGVLTMLILLSLTQQNGLDKLQPLNQIAQVAVTLAAFMTIYSWLSGDSK